MYVFSIPKTALSTNNNDISNFINENKNGNISKAIGNCFVAEKLIDTPEHITSFYVKAVDDGDTAYIYPTQRITSPPPKELYDFNGAILFQAMIHNSVEYRTYITDDTICFYKRDEIEKTDKSESSYFQINNSEIDDSFINKLILFRQKTGLLYLCLDIIYHSNTYYIIDINPFGSIPSSHRFLSIYKKLASILINYKKSES